MAHSGGSQDMKNRLEPYPVNVYPISFPNNGTSYSFVYINEDTIFVYGSYDLFEVNVKTNRWNKIKRPENLVPTTFYRNLKYDKVTNSIYMFCQEGSRSHLLLSSEYLFYILHLDDYTWEAVDVLGKGMRNFYFDSTNTLIYFFQYTTTDSESGRGYITIYDLRKREIIDQVELSDDIHYVCLLYGSPLKVLAAIWNKEIDNGINELGSQNLFIYNISAGARIGYPEIDIKHDPDFFSISLLELIPVKEDGIFLGVKIEGERTKPISKIVEMDLNTKTVKTVALDGFPYFIYNFQQITDRKYGFMISTYNRFGGPGPCYLCFMDLAYP